MNMIALGEADYLKEKL